MQIFANMYYLVFGFFYLLSLLPFRVIYLLSDFAYLIIYHVIGYRKKLVMTHLEHTFPEKSIEERKLIASKVFKNFCDVWVELIKNLSLTKETAARRITYDFSLIEEYYKQGKSIQVVGGHFMNWEYLPVGIPLFQSYQSLAIYMPISNKVIDRLIYHIRGRFGLALLGAGNMANEMKSWHNKQYLMVVGADQSPGNPANAFWLMFCNKPTGFIDGPWKRAIRNNQPYVYLKIKKIKRGHYHFSAHPFIHNPSEITAEKLCLKYARTLEQDIGESPELYLWTHNRWKKKWQMEYATRWIDETPMPTTN